MHNNAAVHNFKIVSRNSAFSLSITSIISAPIDLLPDMTSNLGQSPAVNKVKSNRTCEGLLGRCLPLFKK